MMNARGSGNSGGGIRNTTTQSCTTTYTKGYGRVCAKDMPMSIKQAVATCDLETDNYVAFKFY
ncbi:MAG: hypothetical protein IJ532_05615 [Alphaproteobacteria bacterium]|nr:hypothetical protein [Alphaproteobacteria bacterium]